MFFDGFLRVLARVFRHAGAVFDVGRGGDR